MATLPYRGKEIAALKRQIEKLQKRLEKLRATSRAFRTKAEYDRWAMQFE